MATFEVLFATSLQEFIVKITKTLMNHELSRIMKHKHVKKFKPQGLKVYSIVQATHLDRRQTNSMVHCQQGQTLFHLETTNWIDKVRQKKKLPYKKVSVYSWKTVSPDARSDRGSDGRRDVQRDKGMHRDRRQEYLKKHSQRYCRVCIWKRPHRLEARQRTGNLHLHLTPVR